MPLPLSANIASRSSGVISSPSTSATRALPHATAGPASSGEPLTNRQSVALPYPKPRAIHDSASPGAGGGTGAGGGAASLAGLPASLIRHAVALTSSRPPEVRDAPRHCTRLPSLIISARTSTSATGTGANTSTASRAGGRPGERPGTRANSCTSSAVTGPMCCCRGSHGPWVCSVAWYRP